MYSMKNYGHYLLGLHFKLFMDHSTLKYLINKPVLGGRIFIWLLLFQEYDFEIIVKLGEPNVGLYHLSIITLGEQGASLDDTLLDSYLFRIIMVDEQLEDISYFLTIGIVPKG